MLVELEKLNATKEGRVVASARSHRLLASIEKYHHRSEF